MHIEVSIRPVFLILLLFLALSGVLSPALADTSVIPLVTPTLSQHLLLYGQGEAKIPTSNESLSCDLAHQRALADLQRALVRGRQTYHVTAAHGMPSIPSLVARRWHAQTHTCQITIVS